MPSEFPLEICDIIISHLSDDPFTLTALCLTSTAFISYGQQCLFALFRIDHWNLPSRDPAKFLDAALTSPHLAFYVREFVAPPCEHELEYWVSLLIKALPFTVNLKSFSIFNNPSPPDFLLRALLECSFHLYELGWNWMIQHPDPHQAHLMANFLTKQTEMRTLTQGDVYLCPM